MKKFGRMSLKSRLILAFLAVSVMPVLVSSFLAANAIQSTFRSNLEQWISEASLFLLNEIAETEDEAAKAVATVAATLQRSASPTMPASEAARPFVDLLNSVGYDFVKLYDSTGEVSFASAGVELDVSKLRGQEQWVLPARFDGRPGLLVGASQSFEANGVTYFIIAANALNKGLFGTDSQHGSLDVRVYPVVDGRPVYDLDREAGRAPITVSGKIMRRLSRRMPGGMTLGSGADGITNAFAGVYTADGSLLGVIICRLSGASAIFEELGQLGLFAGLAIIAGLLALVVAGFVSNRITQPVAALTHGLRAVTQGDYKARVAETGGRDLEELGIGFNAMAEQLDRLKSMEAEMRKRQQFAAFGEAAAVIAHEIRNPLGIIKTSSQVVRMKSRLAPAEDRLIGFVLEEVTRIDRLVQDILDYVRPRDSQRVSLDLREVVSHVAEVARPALAERGIRDYVIACGQELPVLGDRDQLHQAFLNLVLNAMDAMPSGGKLRIVEDCREGIARIAIADEGIGMTEEVRQRAFDPFFTTKTRGTGLGLAKVQAIIGEHGGTIQCDSQPGLGTTFTITMSVVQNEGQAHAPIHSAG